MTHAFAAPATGFILERVSTLRQRCETIDAATVDLPEAESADFGWDWRWSDDGAFEVALTLELKPTVARPESLAATVVGRFAIEGTPDKVAPTQFAYGHAPAILFPFMRQVIAGLTMMSPFGPYLLPPVNVAEIMKRFDPSRASAAAQKQTA